jgi:hypothetical protein
MAATAARLRRMALRAVRKTRNLSDSKESSDDKKMDGKKMKERIRRSRVPLYLFVTNLFVIKSFSLTRFALSPLPQDGSETHPTLAPFARFAERFHPANRLQSDAFRPATGPSMAPQAGERLHRLGHAKCFRNGGLRSLGLTLLVLTYDVQSREE